MPARRWRCSPYPVLAADGLARALGVSPVLASVLARRGYSTPEEARRFLAADERHDPALFPEMEAVCDRVLGHVAAGSRIVVHGDYDVDGVCSTAILVQALRELGGAVRWHIPTREDGYGLSVPTVERLAADGTGLLLTTDCAIAAPDEVDAALARGIDVVVTDHHRPGARLPACPILHPALGGYPFPHLCATAIAHKLAEALRAAAGAGPPEHDELDLVALATVCDVVPLVGENRSLVREGLAAFARTRRPGLRALAAVAELEPTRVDERALAFRLGPRLNAAGRLRSAEAALELVLTREERRAAEVARELDDLNRERRDAETRVLFAVEPECRAQAASPAFVLAGEGWQHGVLGIVASRVAERHRRPCVVLGLDGDSARGSGRSIPAFDLHASLAACADHLVRYGGHAAAAGLELRRDDLPAFRAAFVERAGRELTPHDLVPVEHADAVVSAGALGLPLAEELARLAPFGHGNREPTLLVPSARVEQIAAMGEDGQHARLTLASGGGRARAVAFRMSPRSLADAEGHQDVAVTLEVREWMGAVEGRPVVRSVTPTPGGRCRVLGEGDFWAGVRRALEAAPQDPDPGPPGRLVRDRRGEGIAALAGELITSGEPVVLVCADAARRRAALERLVAGMSAEDEHLALVEWDALVADPELIRGFTHALAVDPPPTRAAAAALAGGGGRAARAARGVALMGWGEPEVEFALAVAVARLDLAQPLRDLYRRLRADRAEARGPVAGEPLRSILRGDGAYPRGASSCGLLLRVLRELGLVELDLPGAGPVSCRVVAPAGRVALEASAGYADCARRLEEARSYLKLEARALAERRAAPVPALPEALAAAR